MITAIVLIDTERNAINRIAEAVAGLDGVSESCSISGEHDVLAILRVAGSEALADLVTRQLVDIDGILNTRTLLAFQAWSRHDPESMFDL